MEMYTPEDIIGLIGCKKKTIQPPKKDMKLERGSFRNDMTLESLDGTKRFSAFMRQNQAFQENFSIGLRYHPREGQSFTLIRCNGPHGPHIGLEAGPHAHYTYHIHRAQAARVNEGNLSERDAIRTGEYASYEEALIYFIRTVGIADAEKYFPDRVFQMPLFTMEAE